MVTLPKDHVPQGNYLNNGKDLIRVEVSGKEDIIDHYHV